MFYYLEDFVECKKCIKNIQEIGYSRKDYKNLNAFKSIFFNNFRWESHKALVYIDKALEQDDLHCDVWVYIKAKNLRRIRRDRSIFSKPTQEEMDLFQKAFSLSKSDNIVYLLFTAQSLREQRKHEDSLQLYEAIVDKLNTNNSSSLNLMYLRAALGLMNAQKPCGKFQYYFDKAKFCLDKIDENYQNDSMYLHYRGIYYLRTKDYMVIKL